MQWKTATNQASSSTKSPSVSKVYEWENVFTSISDPHVIYKLHYNYKKNMSCKLNEKRHFYLNQLWNQWLAAKDIKLDDISSLFLSSNKKNIIVFSFNIKTAIITIIDTTTKNITITFMTKWIHCLEDFVEKTLWCNLLLFLHINIIVYKWIKLYFCRL